ncbi:helix-turn-helix transcriptional regulator [Antribacter gilvus]|uniref:helix-turn-helix transcriptional regulator n=1 Tax=Antribacter gilvus TaxID=2304675 RepID=UPI0023E7E543|nr:helix-turn-helix transcriptional regulator [Antribacter gilvus]
MVTEAEEHPDTAVAEDGAATQDAARDTVFNRIAMLRAERGISRRELAEALGVHYQTIGYLERGEYSPSLHLALRIAEYFGVTVEVIFSTRPFRRLGDPDV